ncbi:hypothetical protein CIB84_014778 [Bambusicola thoracicus]|uniref:Uncharacterized protein n=1 Tax=Bambusicola thoracicus TaxID=9083 RepID=A0A2P4SBJ5_BAMTH|nr:hypothetical protein CIB84_014778 [Bambusicola thoracicus]
MHLFDQRSLLEPGKPLFLPGRQQRTAKS